MRPFAPALACLVLSLLPSPVPAVERPALAVMRAASPLHVDGVLDEPAWAAAGEARAFQLISPREGEAPAESTSIRVLRDGERLVFAIRCGARRAPHAGLAARDQVLDGDHISVHLDTDGDGQRAYIFGVNPYGVQLDGILTGGPDFKWDGVWDAAEDLGEKPELESDPDARAVFDSLPAAATQPKNYAGWSKELTDCLYRTRTLDLYSCPSLKLVAKPGESEGDFKVRVQQAAREKRDAAVEILRAKYAGKADTLRNQEQRAAERVAREQSQASQQTMQAAISVGATLLGALFGRKAVSVGSIGRATTAARGVGRTMKERQDVDGAEQSVEAVRQKIADLEAELKSEIEELTSANELQSFAIGRIQGLRPGNIDGKRKSRADLEAHLASAPPSYKLEAL